MSATNAAIRHNGGGEHPHDPDALLRQIGDDLDQGRSLIVHRGGEVWSSAGRPALTLLGNSEGVIQHGVDIEEPSRSERSAAWARTRATGDGAAVRQGAPSSTASFFGGAGLTDQAVDDLAAVIEEYQQFNTRFAPPGVWLVGTIRPICGAPDAATLVVAYPTSPTVPIRAWAWWNCGIWIGPRHTNYGDGSICAFEVTDGSWNLADGTLRLIDLYTTWIVRHLYLRRFGRWPGAQVLHTAFERLREQLPGEQCGGCRSGAPYDECCRGLDLQRGWIDARREFAQLCPNSLRRAPASFADCVRLACEPLPRFRVHPV